MAVGVLEIEASPSTTGVDLHVLRIGRPAPISDTLDLHPIKNRVEVFIGHLEGVVAALKLLSIIKVKSKGVVYLHEAQRASRGAAHCEQNMRPFRLE